jgi:hypothetical protein
MGAGTAVSHSLRALDYSAIHMKLKKMCHILLLMFHENIYMSNLTIFRLKIFCILA